jgi:hypothetical protein
LEKVVGRGLLGTREVGGLGDESSWRSFFGAAGFEYHIRQGDGDGGGCIFHWFQGRHDESGLRGDEEGKWLG